MATKTITIDAGEMVYVDSTGIRHTVTTSQDFTVTMTDVSATLVKYSVNIQDAMTTTDGYKLNFRPEYDGASVARYFTLRDAKQNGTPDYQAPGEICIECPVTGRIQRWKIAKVDIDDVDAPTAITALTLEDQFGNKMVLPSTGSGITVS